MAFTNAWDETAPAGTRNANLGDDDIRQFKLDIRERIAIDHKMTGTDGSDTGYHGVVHLNVSTTQTAVASVGLLYTKDVSSKAELHFKDEDGDEIQLTAGGALLVPAGAIILWDGAGCPTGWTLLTSYDDKFLIGSGTAGTTGGDNNSKTPAGTNAAETSHTHSTTVARDNWGGADAGSSSGRLTTTLATAEAVLDAATADRSFTSGGGASHNHAFTGTADTGSNNRPAFKTIKLCKKD